MKQLPQNAFHWQGKPSIFASDHTFNGVNARRSEMSSQSEPISLSFTNGVIHRAPQPFKEYIHAVPKVKKKNG